MRRGLEGGRSAPVVAWIHQTHSISNPEDEVVSMTRAYHNSSTLNSFLRLYRQTHAGMSPRVTVRYLLLCLVVCLALVAADSFAAGLKPYLWTAYLALVIPGWLCLLAKGGEATAWHRQDREVDRLNNAASRAVRREKLLRIRGDQVARMGDRLWDLAEARRPWDDPLGLLLALRCTGALWQISRLNSQLRRLVLLVAKRVLLRIARPRSPASPTPQHPLASLPCAQAGEPRAPPELLTTRPNALAP